MTTTATYNNVKTNIAWMPELPEHWKLSRVKNYFTFSNEVVGEDYSGFNVLSLSVNGVIIRDMESGKGKHSMSMDLYQIVQPKSIILCLFDMDVTPRIVGICENLGIITSAYTTIVPKENVCVRFYYYFFLHQDYNKSLKAQGTGVRTTLTNTQFGAVKIPVPPYQEQIQIANYLDNQSQKINHFIAKKQQFVALLKEQRQSVINDKLKINAKKIKIKYCVSKVGTGVTPTGGASVYKSSGVIFLRSQNVHNDGLRLNEVAYITEEIHSEMKGSQVQFGDVLVNVTGASIGRCFVFDKTEEANVNQHVCILRPKQDVILSEFLMLQIQSERIQTLINMIEGASREGLTNNEVKNYYLFVPSLKDQENIISEIKTETTTIDTAIAKTEREIELIKEYKEAMIAEAVMGKVNFNKQANK